MRRRFEMVYASMLEKRSLKSDLFALGLLVLVVFLAISLFSYSSADPIVELVYPLDQIIPHDTVVYPPNDQIVNACGKWGAFAAHLLLTEFGLGAFYLLFSMAIVDYLLLRRHEIDAPVARCFGWILSLMGLTAIVSVVAPGLSLGPVIGAGGYLGALGKGVLELHFATAGTLVIAGSLVLAGLLLCTDYMLLRIAAKVLGWTGHGFGKVAGLRPRRKRRSDLDAVEATPTTSEDSIDDEAEADELPVKFRRKPTDDSAEETEPLDDAVTSESTDEGESAGNEEPAVIKKRSNTRADKGHDKSKLKIRKPLPKNERDQVIEKLNEAVREDETGNYDLPSVDLLLPSDDFPFDEQEKEVRRKAKVLEKTFGDFGFKVRVVEVETGPVIAQYEVELEAGLRLSRITSLADDLAIALRVPSVRIVAPIPGKNTVGIEVPNESRQVVRLREVIEEATAKTRKMRIPLFLGKDVSGNPLCVDLSTLPHLLIAGRTGTGKSVCLNAIISSILMTRRPDEVRMLMIDPKMVELSGYGRLPHLMHPVVTDMRKAEAILAWAVDKMEERYALLAKAGVRHIASYNQLGEEELMDRLEPETDEERDSIPLHLPFIVIVADEIADLMMTAGKEVEQHIIRLAQKSRAVGIHLILATQKPTVDVITGLIKSNLPARISFQVASRTDSRVVLDEMGAEKLLGNGDMLFLWPGTSMLLRGQGTYLNDEEIDAVVDCASTGEQNFVHELLNMKVEDASESDTPGQLKKRDDLYESAVDVVVREGRGSVSLLQRTLGIGYGRAARMIDWMAEDSIVGSYAGSQAREVLVSVSDWERMQGHEPEEDVVDEPELEQPTSRRNKPIRPHDKLERSQVTAVRNTAGYDEDDDQYYYDDDAETSDLQTETA